jgi:hypothetical protein
MPRFHNINGKRVQFTEAEEAARDIEEAAAQVQMAEEKAKHDKAMAKKGDYDKKGWFDAMCVLEDMAERGADVVLAEMKVEKDKNKD